MRRYPWEFEKCLTELEAINKKAWEISETSQGISETYSTHSRTYSYVCINYAQQKIGY
jgi:hypothetical protein